MTTHASISQVECPTSPDVAAVTTPPNKPSTMADSDAVTRSDTSLFQTPWHSKKLKQRKLITGKKSIQKDEENRLKGPHLKLKRKSLFPTDIHLKDNLQWNPIPWSHNLKGLQQTRTRTRTTFLIIRSIISLLHHLNWYHGQHPHRYQHDWYWPFRW